MPAKPAAICVSKMFVTVRVPDAAQDRDVLAPGVEDDLDLRVGEHAGQRRGVERRGERVEHLDPLRSPSVRRDGDLDEAQQRAVAALAHELGVDRELAGLPCALRRSPRRRARSGCWLIRRITR